MRKLTSMFKPKRLPLLLGLGAMALIDVSLAATIEEVVVSPVTIIEEQTGSNPWSHLEFPNADIDFQFAIVSDNTGGAYPGVFDAAMTKLNLLQPEFVMSVGDLIEGYSNNREALTAEWEEIDASVDKLEMPFFYVVGNHDIGDPASAEVWRERLGRSYYHFRYKDVLFLCMNTEDPPQDLPAWLLEGMAKVSKTQESDPAQAEKIKLELLARMREAFVTGEEYMAAFSDQQVGYFKKVIAANPDVKWTFVFVHRPVWQANPQDKKFMEIEAALSGRPYTVFAGHAHTYEYQERKGMDYIRLSTTGGAWVFDPPGNFDHIAWVTMTDEGPVVANITLDGIFDKTGKRLPVRETLQ
ncbi:metallophosphoesterase family protein [Haliea salexigens]|uniref:metallophosphoesterase family protein n=1 Tax=Haliea salexigens TaxID=287487 RepID=UPI000A033A3C|nr:metallophosphoesterase [Haliea salexigens]